jgi:phenylalanyl-tRNA synthetase beta chain
MKFSYEWLKDLSNTKLKAEQLASLLELHTAETDINKPKIFKDIIVAEVVSFQKHPNADRLRVVELRIGSDQIISPIVCGANNFSVKDKVALALPGAIIPVNTHGDGNPFVLTKAVIRGVESQGMICSGKELGISEDHEGILLLNSDLKLGQNFQVADKNETIEISIPANRPDLASYTGIAREISALENRRFQSTKINAKYFKKSSSLLKVKIADKSLCKRYIATRLSGLTIAPSPKFIQDRLVASGLNPKNNIVDITNYVMLLIGQPLHAFDAQKVNGNLNVRTAYLNETLVTLDNVARKLNKNSLVIADSQKALAVAGIIGGLDSAISESTSEIILEAANFNPVNIRRTSKFLGIRTDSSSRFERGLPPVYADYGLSLAIDLFIKYANASVVDTYLSGQQPESAPSIPYDYEKSNQILGLNLTLKQHQQILSKLGFEFIKTKGLSVIPPLWRADITIWQDIAEEVGRFQGLDSIPFINSLVPFSKKMSDPKSINLQPTSDFISRLGYQEIYTYSFVSEKDLHLSGYQPKQCLQIDNFLSLDQQYLRPSLSINMIKVGLINARNFSETKFFEIGNTYNLVAGKIIESTKIAFLYSSTTTNNKQPLPTTINKLLSEFSDEYEIKQIDEHTAEIFINKQKIGYTKYFSIDDIHLFYAEIDYDYLALQKRIYEFRPFSRFPASKLDLSILIKETQSWQEINSFLRKQKYPFLVSYNLIDTYKGKGIPERKKSYTLRLVLNSKEKTLTESEINETLKRIQHDLINNFHCEIRN